MRIEWQGRRALWVGISFGSRFPKDSFLARLQKLSAPNRLHNFSISSFNSFCAAIIVIASLTAHEKAFVVFAVGFNYDKGQGVMDSSVARTFVFNAKRKLFCAF